MASREKETRWLASYTQLARSTTSELARELVARLISGPSLDVVVRGRGEVGGAVSSAVGYSVQVIVDIACARGDAVGCAFIWRNYR